MLMESLSGILTVLAIGFLKLSFASSQALQPQNTTAAHKSANHIFNAIHSSMRQWGSSLNHNGMSFFPAYVAAGTELYHGTGTPDQVEVMEWLAFEPEHAYNFAVKFSWEPPTNGSENNPSRSIKWLPESVFMGSLIRQDLKSGQDGLENSFYESTQRPFTQSEGESSRRMHASSRPRLEVESGWLHTYVMKHDLRLIYIDGQSAAKSLKGTLDSQDFILVSGGQYLNDRPRALRMCKIAADQWNGRIDGFIRMEHGFELILCDFQTNADLIRVERANNTLGFSTQVDELRDMVAFSFWKAITARYRGIGMSRVVLDYSRMVTAFAYGFDLFHGRNKLPRLQNVSSEIRTEIVADLSTSVMHNDYKPSPQWVDWQAVTDMIVTRYSDALQELAFSSFYNSKKLVDFEIDQLMRPFIDFNRRNTSIESQRCASHFMSFAYDSSVASTAVFTVSERICLTLFAAAKLYSLDNVRQSFKELIEYLEWTSWKECRGCQYDEICVTAIWPYGDREDHTHPSCKNKTSLGEGRGDYWQTGPRV
ncbi:hypothetical protein MMC25_000996 [Agyrium rufum]|nr:hypothetical protein [Agyrium rufum]